MILPHGPSCRVVFWLGSLCITVSMVAANTLLLAKAYLAHQRNRWLLAAGALLIVIPSPVNIWAICFCSHLVLTPDIGCLMVFPDYYPWLKFGLDAPLNIIFSVAFLLVVHRQYRKCGTDLWAQLGRDGLAVMLLVVASNLTSCTQTVDYYRKQRTP
ncbi:hypothetical protein THASP1DRAFT_22414 [Thamnocephalis sphaerospora]|uniref:G-protein coupled receptors family 1 profile domain-containing protein n=1 Tax=Thamnocephalis sphaerospora TaxID=78915 RepID=A0A4V1IX44_9FUNG|nr:hypothetical protein THASP1DRAFT_22414 [Thamnocephalis sphaerospora]|eukprot:RKP09769.1 hypothetical protein THASP1DRAFT_22414 [Thamnocephalis sphaerospora]